jgi:hypothetical protein
MRVKKILLLIFLPLAIVSFLHAQSVAELAKKEKERRAALKGKKIVVTNDDLGRIKKKPSMTAGARETETVAEETEAGETRKTEEEKANEITPPGESVENAPSEGQAPASIREEYDQRKAELEQKIQKALEMADLLTTKILALQQEFYNTSEPKTRDQIQQALVETNKKLEAAREDALKGKEELDRLTAAPPPE